MLRNLEDSIFLGYDDPKMGKWIPMFRGNVAFSSSNSHEDLSTNFRIWLSSVNMPCPKRMESSAILLQNPQNIHSKNFSLLNSQMDMMFNSCSPPCAGSMMFNNIIQDSSSQTRCQQCPSSSSSCCLSVIENGIHLPGTMFWYRWHAAITLPLPQSNIIHISGMSTYVFDNI